MIIGPYKTCQYSSKCPVSQNCYGAFENRPNHFECDFVDMNGNFNYDLIKERTIFNKTGKYEILLEHGEK